MRRTFRARVESLDGRALPSAALTAVLKTDHASYRPGQSVRITLIETNRTRHDVQVAVGPSLDGVTVSQSGREVWRSNAGLQPDFVALETLHPGQSLKESVVWDGSHPEAAPAHPYGTYVIGDADSGAKPVTIRFLKPPPPLTPQQLAFLNWRTHPAGGRTSYGYGYQAL